MSEDKLETMADEAITEGFVAMIMPATPARPECLVVVASGPELRSLGEWISSRMPDEAWDAIDPRLLAAARQARDELGETAPTTELVERIRKIAGELK